MVLACSSGCSLQINLSQSVCLVLLPLATRRKQIYTYLSKSQHVCPVTASFLTSIILWDNSVDQSAMIARWHQQHPAAWHLPAWNRNFSLRFTDEKSQCTWRTVQNALRVLPLCWQISCLWVSSRNERGAGVSHDWNLRLPLSLCSSRFCCSGLAGKPSARSEGICSACWWWWSWRSSETRPPLKNTIRAHAEG